MLDEIIFSTDKSVDFHEKIYQQKLVSSSSLILTLTFFVLYGVTLLLMSLSFLLKSVKTVGIFPANICWSSGRLEDVVNKSSA